MIDGHTLMEDKNIILYDYDIDKQKWIIISNVPDQLISNTTQH